MKFKFQMTFELQNQEVNKISIWFEFIGSPNLERKIWIIHQKSILT
jgi:hypothetical protein